MHALLDQRRDGTHFSHTLSLICSAVGFPQTAAHSSLLPAQWTASVRDTGALLVHSPHDRDGFSAAPNLYLNSIKTSGHSSLVCSHVLV